MDIRRIIFFALVACFTIWLPLAFFGLCGQRSALSCSGDLWQSDFWMPRITLELGYSALPSAEITKLTEGKKIWPNAKTAVNLYDRCYPPVGMLPLAPFPLSQQGADFWMLFGAAAYLAIVAVAIGFRKALPLALTAPFVFNFVQSNTIWLAAATATIFLVWHDSSVRSRRLAAAIALGLAASMKFSPALLGAMYLPKIFGKDASQRRSALGCAALAATAFLALFIIPFTAMPDGFGGMRAMFANAVENGRHYGAISAFGLGALYRSFLIVVKGSWSAADPVLRSLQGVGQLLGLAAIACGAWRKDRTLAAAGMILTFPNMMFYSLLYLLPAIAAEKRPLTWFEGVLLFMMTCPLQLTVTKATGQVLSANPTLANAALIALMAVRLSGHATTSGDASLN